MRKCPKCGTTYSDSDLRTMCSGCLVNLERVDDTDALVEMATPGPISLGPITPPSSEPALPPSTGSFELAPAPPPVLPEITLPEPPAPREAPDPRIDVDAALNAEEHTLAELAATAPPVEAPPTPMTTVTPPPSMRPEAATPPLPTGPDTTGSPVGPLALDLDLPAANPTPPPLQRSAPAPPVAKPVPPSGWVREEPVAAPVTARPLTPGAIGAASGRSGGFIFLAFFCGVIALLTLFNTSPGDFNPGTLLVVGGMIMLLIVAVRKAIYYGVIQSAELTPLVLPALGAVVPVRVTIGVLKDIPVTDIEVTLIARERAVSRGGKNDSASTHELYTQTVRIPAGDIWAGGQAMSFIANLAVPPDAPPSFAGRNNFIEWALKLWVGIPGWNPDIRITTPIDVRPLLQNGTPPAIIEHNLPAPALSELHARVTLQCAATGSDPQLQTGSDVPVTVTINPAEGNADQRLSLELAYHITGSGTGEDRNVAALVCFPSGWSAGSQSMSGTLRIPTGMPISYDGRHIRIRWTLSLRQQAPWQFDKVQAYEVVMAPALLPPNEPPPEEPSPRAAQW